MNEVKKVQVELCPICGSSPIIKEVGLERYPENHVYTMRCGCCNMPESQSETDIYQSKKDAIHSVTEKWNKQSKEIIGYLLNNPYLKESINKKEDK